MHLLLPTVLQLHTALSVTDILFPSVTELVREPETILFCMHHHSPVSSSQKTHWLHTGLVSSCYPMSTIIVTTGLSLLSLFCIFCHLIRLYIFCIVFISLFVSSIFQSNHGFISLNRNMKFVLFCLIYDKWGAAVNAFWGDFRTVYCSCVNVSHVFFHGKV